jgi:upstream activation factor subunit UAF30
MASHLSQGANMPNAALGQKLKPSKQLAVVLGGDNAVSRADALKGIWDYVKKHNLQNPENRREILADENLEPLFGKNKITMFEVGKIVNSNLESDGSPQSRGKKAA